MEIFETSISGVLIIEPCVFKYSCGYFSESFSQREFDHKVTPILGIVSISCRAMSQCIFTVQTLPVFNEKLSAKYKLEINKQI